MDPGTEGDVLSMVANPSRFLVRKGFTVVKMRGQADIDGRVPLNDALQAESKFFEDHLQYRWVNLIPHYFKSQISFHCLTVE